MRFYNPFRKIRELEFDLKAALIEVERWKEDARYARKEAMCDAMDHFERRTYHLRAQNEQLLKNAMDIMAATPQPAFFSKDHFDQGK